MLGFHLARMVGYAAAGAAVAASVAGLAWLGQWSAVLRPLWTMAHMAALALGLWLLIRGQQPAWLDQLGRSGQRVVPSSEGRWQPMLGPAKAAAVGSVWFAWPCGLLQSALMVAALANSAWGGAAVMAVFALASGVALGASPVLWRRWVAGRGDGLTRWAVRLSGLALAAASAWALGHDVWVRVAAYCLS